MYVMFVIVRMSRASHNTAVGRSDVSSVSLIIHVMGNAVNAQDAMERQRQPGNHNAPIIMADNLS